MAGPVTASMRFNPCARPTHTVGVPSGSSRVSLMKCARYLLVSQRLKHAMNPYRRDVAFAARGHVRSQPVKRLRHVHRIYPDAKNIRTVSVHFDSRFGIQIHRVHQLCPHASSHSGHPRVLVLNGPTHWVEHDSLHASTSGSGRSAADSADTRSGWFNAQEQ